MNIKTVKLIYFSPTRTTMKVIEGIAQGLQLSRVEYVDLTLSEAKTRKPPELHEELAIIGSPVYSGRIPVEAESRLRLLKGNGGPAVIVVVYGNRAYEDALLELRDLAVERGFKPIAAGAFIGEHSFSTDAAPIAAGRPDMEDMRIAREFGSRIREKMKNSGEPGGVLSVQVPGHFPYRERGALSNISPVTQEAICAKCEKCVSVCPTAAISVRDSVVTESNACIRCCACIKICSTGARLMEEPRIKQIAEQLSANCRVRREPELYL